MFISLYSTIDAITYLCSYMMPVLKSVTSIKTQQKLCLSQELDTHTSHQVHLDPDDD